MTEEHSRDGPSTLLCFGTGNGSGLWPPRRVSGHPEHYGDREQGPNPGGVEPRLRQFFAGYGEYRNKQRRVTEDRGVHHQQRVQGHSRPHLTVQHVVESPGGAAARALQTGEDSKYTGREESALRGIEKEEEPESRDPDGQPQHGDPASGSRWGEEFARGGEGGSAGRKLQCISAITPSMPSPK